MVAWNRAAAVVLKDYGALPAGQRNILRMIFTNPQVQETQYDWEGMARMVVAAFRVDAARAGAAAQVSELVEELCRISPHFDALWRDNDVRSFGEGVKHLKHPELGPITFEHSAFAVDGRTDLGMVIYNPTTPEDAARIRELIRLKSS